MNVNSMPHLKALVTLVANGAAEEDKKQNVVHYGANNGKRDRLRKPDPKKSLTPTFARPGSTKGKEELSLRPDRSHTCDPKSKAITVIPLSDLKGLEVPLRAKRDKAEAPTYYRAGDAAAAAAAAAAATAAAAAAAATIAAARSIADEADWKLCS